jgi:hypothetical protein
VDKSTVPPDSQRHEFPWKEILRLRDEHPSNGLYFAYGLRGNNFIPVVSLFRGERTNYELVPGATFISDKTGLILRTITTQEIDRIAGEYLSRITTKLLNNPTPQPIKTDDLSTIGIYYTWPMLDTLFKHNKQIEETRKLVVTCISTQLAEGDFDLLENDEYRHTLSLHVAELMESGYQDRVRNDPTQEYFAYRAMNYGSVCPKNCPKR